MRKPILLTGLVALALVAGAAVGWHWWPRQSRFEAAVAAAPAQTQRVTWTDWSGIRTALKMTDPAGADGLERLLDRGYQADLTSTSALLSSGAWLRTVDLSPATLDSETLTQSDEGAAVALRVRDGFDFDALTAELTRAGFVAPAHADDAWTGGPDLATSLGLSPELQYWVLSPDDSLIVTSDRAAYAELAGRAARGEADRIHGLGHVVAALETPLSAVVLAEDYTCSRLAMGQADDVARDQADQLISSAGKVTPLDGFAVGLSSVDRGRFVLGFDSDDHAAANARARATLASGEAPGQGGTFADRFTLDKAAVDGRVVTLDVTPADGAYVISDLSSGPVLFATC